MKNKHKLSLLPDLPIISSEGVLLAGIFSALRGKKGQFQFIQENSEKRIWEPILPAPQIDDRLPENGISRDISPKTKETLTKEAKNLRKLWYEKIRNNSLELKSAIGILTEYRYCFSIGNFHSWHPSLISSMENYFQSAVVTDVHEAIKIMSTFAFLGRINNKLFDGLLNLCIDKINDLHFTSIKTLATYLTLHLIATNDEAIAHKFLNNQRVNLQIEEYKQKGQDNFEVDWLRLILNHVDTPPKMFEQRIVTNKRLERQKDNSQFESDIRVLLLDSGLNFLREKDVSHYKVDFFFNLGLQHIVIETDGDEFHFNQGKVSEGYRSQDKIKNRVLQEAGYRVIRISHTEYTEALQNRKKLSQGQELEFLDPNKSTAQNPDELIAKKLGFNSLFELALEQTIFESLRNLRINQSPDVLLNKANIRNYSKLIIQKSKNTGKEEGVFLKVELLYLLLELKFKSISESILIERISSWLAREANFKKEPIPQILAQGRYVLLKFLNPDLKRSHELEFEQKIQKELNRKKKDMETRKSIRSRFDEYRDNIEGIQDSDEYQYSLFKRFLLRTENGSKTERIFKYRMSYEKKAESTNILCSAEHGDIINESGIHEYKINLKTAISPDKERQLVEFLAYRYAKKFESNNYFPNIVFNIDATVAKDPNSHFRNVQQLFLNALKAYLEPVELDLDYIEKYKYNYLITQDPQNPNISTIIFKISKP